MRDTRVSYTINHYKQSSGVEPVFPDDYTLADTESFKAEAGTNVTPDVKTYQYFVAPETQTVEVASDGSTVVNYLYNYAITTINFYGNGNDSGNYSPDDNAKWPGIKISDTDGDGWFDYSFTYTGTGTYNVILSKNGSPQTKDYKGYVSNEMWIVINDSRVYSSNDFATLYSENPDENPNAPIAPHIY